MRAPPFIPNKDESCIRARENYSSQEKYNKFKEQDIFNTDENKKHSNHNFTSIV